MAIDGVELGRTLGRIENKLEALEGMITGHDHQHTHPEIIDVLERHEDEIHPHEEDPPSDPPADPDDPGDDPADPPVDPGDVLPGADDPADPPVDPPALVDPAGEDPGSRPSRVHFLHEPINWKFWQ